MKPLVRCNLGVLPGSDPVKPLVRCNLGVLPGSDPVKPLVRCNLGVLPGHSMCTVNGDSHRSTLVSIVTEKFEYL